MRRLVPALAAAGCAALLAACSSAGASPHVAAPSPNLGVAVDVAVPASVANLPLTKPDGTTTSLADFHGKPVMIADYMTLCEDICPMITANTMQMGRALDAAGLGDNVTLLEVTIDPARDNLRRIAAYQKLYGRTPSDVTLLRADAAGTKAFWKFFGVQLKRVPQRKPADTDWLTGKPLTYDIQHSDALIFLDASGHERFAVNGGPNVAGKTSTVPTRLRSVLSDEGKQDLFHPNAIADWTAAQGLGVLSWLLDRPIPGASSS